MRLARLAHPAARALEVRGLSRSCASSAVGAVDGAAAKVPAARPRRWGRWLLTAGVAGTGGAFVYTMRSREKRREECVASFKNVTETPVATRAHNIKRLASGEEFDLLVVGGGATGAGIALDAQSRGLKVALVEQEDFGSGTSSKSTKLLWAGSRYLVKGLVTLFGLSSLKDPVGAFNDFLGTWHMVLGCFRERTYMLQMNPHLTSWVPIGVPLDTWIIWPPPFDYPPAALGPATGLFVVFFKVYDAIGLWAAPSSYVMSAAQATAEFPQMDGKRMKYVSVFYEGQHNDARTNLCIALTAAMHGACIANYARVSSVLFNESGVACGAEIVDMAAAGAPSEPFKVHAKKVVYAGGPYTDGLRELSEGKDVQKIVNGAGGTHIVLPQYYCPRHMGLVDMMTSKGSFLFFLPWEGYTLVGTTDVAQDSPELHNAVPEDEIQYIINECEKYLSPNLQVRRRDVMSAWYGVRPLTLDPNASDTASVSRDHIVSHHPTNGITFVSGGKWTTWREMAEDCVDQVVKQSPYLLGKAGPCKTLEMPLIGAGRSRGFPEGYHENLAVQLTQRFDVAWDIAQHLVRNYGTRAPDVLQYYHQSSQGAEGGEFAEHFQAPVESRTGLYKHYPRLYEGAAASTGYPYLDVEVAYAVDHEYAVTVADILGRRTRLAFLNSNAAKLSIPKVVELMAQRLGWDAERCALETQRAEEVLGRDFAGPVPNKSGAILRTACTADVKDIFDRIDTRGLGSLSREGISAASVALGFPLDDRHLGEAMEEMSSRGEAEVSFPEFLMWWNSSRTSKDLQDALGKETTVRPKGQH